MQTSPSSNITNKGLINRWFEDVWNKKREAAIHEMMHPEAIIHGLGSSAAETARGPGSFVPFWRKFVSAFPDVKITVECILADGDRLAALCTVRGQHTGEGLGVKATQANVTFSGVCMVQLKDGMLYEGWNHFDFLGLYQQLGLIKMAA